MQQLSPHVSGMELVSKESHTWYLFLWFINSSQSFCHCCSFSHVPSQRNAFVGFWLAFPPCVPTKCQEEGSW